MSTPLLWSDRPATCFTEAWPLGNGRIGMMVQGGIAEERIVLNEAGCWSGSRVDNDRSGAAVHLPEIRRLLREGRHREAQELVHGHFSCAGAGAAMGNGSTVPFGCYQVLGELRLAWPSLVGVASSAYRHELDLAGALATATFMADGGAWCRQAFVSAPHQVAALRLEAPAGTAMQVELSRSERATVTHAGADLLLTLRLSDGQGGVGVTCVAHLRVLVGDGRVEADGAGLRIVHGRQPVVLLIAAVGDMRSFAGRRSDAPAAACVTDLDAAQKLGWAALLAAHQAEHRQWFDRCHLDLSGGRADLPTGARLAAAQQVADPGLDALLFTYGRYLLIACSRPGCLPANLQGIWSEDVQTPWNGDWHLDINVQMNYWPAAVTGLAELEQPLFAMIDSLVEPGTRTAAAYYGARGWVAHVFTNPWGFTSPGEHASWGATTSGSPWLCTHLVENFAFTRDRGVLERHWPALAGAARFAIDSLSEDNDGCLVTGPSNSPENGFLVPEGGQIQVCSGPTIDSQLLRALFTGLVHAGALLGRDAALCFEAAAACARLPATRIGPDAAIAEWRHDLPSSEPQHRHISHLWGLYPGHEISPATTPELAVGARKSLDLRGDGGTGWSLAWKVAFWARMGDGDRAERLLHAFKTPKAGSGIQYDGGGVYANLLCAHPPFQIDGNLGVTAAIADMLAQSRWDGAATSIPAVALLPALPSAWPAGRVAGLRLRGGGRLDLHWAAGRLVEARLTSDQDGPWRITAPMPLRGATPDGCWTLRAGETLVLALA